MAGSSVLRACALCLLQSALSSGLGMVQVPQNEGQLAPDAAVVATPETPKEPGQPDDAGVAGDRASLAEYPEQGELDVLRTAMHSLRRVTQAKDVQFACDELGQAVLANHILAQEALRMSLREILQLKLLQHKTKPQVVSACIGAMVNVVAYNWKLLSTQTDFIQYVLKAIQRHGTITPKIMVHAAMLQDNCYRNRQYEKKLGVPEAVLEVVKKSPTPGVVFSAQCFVSSYCGPTGFTSHLAGLGYIPTALQAMRDFRNSTGIRGLILNNLHKCFLKDKAYLDQMLEHGIVTEVLSVVNDELTGVAQVDEEGSMRLYSNALDIMTTLVGSYADAKAEFLQKGVMDQMSRMVSAVNSEGGDMLFPASRMIRGCPTSLNLGHPPNLASRTCIALKALAAGPGWVGQAAPPPLLEGLRALLRDTTNLMRFDPASVYECAEYGMQVKGAEMEAVEVEEKNM